LPALATAAPHLEQRDHPPGQPANQRCDPAYPDEGHGRQRDGPKEIHEGIGDLEHACDRGLPCEERGDQHGIPHKGMSQKTAEHPDTDAAAHAQPTGLDDEPPPQRRTENQCHERRGDEERGVPVQLRHTPRLNLHAGHGKLHCAHRREQAGAGGTNSDQEEGVPDICATGADEGHSHLLPLLLEPGAV